MENKTIFLIIAIILLVFVSIGFYGLSLEFEEINSKQTLQKDLTKSYCKLYNSELDFSNNLLDTIEYQYNPGYIEVPRLEQLDCNSY